MREPSRHILEAFSGVGSPSLECTCGRHHHAVDSEYLEDDEDLTMKEDAARNPTKVILHHGVDCISAKVINGMAVVLDCPCEFLVKFENILWHHRANILDYYRMRRDADAAELAKLDCALNGGGSL